MKLKKLFCVALSALIMLLSGCSEIAQTSEEYIPPEYTPQAYPITVEGISFEKSPSAIVCLSPTLADMLFELAVLGLCYMFGSMPQIYFVQKRKQTS